VNLVIARLEYEGVRGRPTGRAGIRSRVGADTPAAVCDRDTSLQSRPLDWPVAMPLAATSGENVLGTPLRGLSAALALPLLLLPVVLRAEPAANASTSIDALHVALLDVMKNAVTLGYDGRAAKLAPVIPEHFDTVFMARKAVGRHWKTASDEEKRRYLEAFQRFMVANYAGQFDGYSGQRFETKGVESARMDTVIVHTVLVNPDDEDVELNYRMRQVDDRWKIIDVYMDGTVSELALRRSEFSSIVKREDFDALIAAIDEKTAKLASGTDES
jgi:phospholipid transport system substrate-binding protein